MSPRIIRWAYKGRSYRSLVLEAPCPQCGAHAVIALTGPVLAEQRDGTTHVCHPSAGGCNCGFALEYACRATPRFPANRAAGHRTRTEVPS